MKKYFFYTLILGIIIFTFGCSQSALAPTDLMINDKLTLSTEEKAKQYPYFNIQFAGFNVEDKDPGRPENPTEEQKKRARIFTAKGKRYMLRGMDFVRFVLNTPEFSQAVKETPMYLRRAGTGPLGSTKVGDKADPDRLLYILQNSTYHVQIRKISLGAVAAVGVVGTFRYNHPTTYYKDNYRSWLAFPSHANLDEGGYVQDSYYHAGTILHEVLHNLGFTHGSVGESPDVVYGLAGVFREIAKNKDFLAKYDKELNSFRPFYEKKHSQWFSFDSIAGQDPPFTIKSIRTQQNAATFDYQQETDAINNQQEICLLAEDDTYNILTKKEFQLLHGKIEN
ncbi:MAG: hypothetical protein ACRC5H_06695 [Treponemataceae bacterium]